jgi:hypothetical protein
MIWEKVPVASSHREMNRLFDDVFHGFESSHFGEVVAHGPVLWRKLTRSIG